MTDRQRRRSQAQRREDSKARILTAAIDLVIEKGFDRFSLQDIGKAAKCSHELVNFYFGSKDGLLNALATHIIGNISDELRSVDQSLDGFENFAAKIHYIAGVADRNIKTFTAYMRTAGDAPFRQPLAPLFLERRKQTVEILRDTIVAGQASGDIHRHIDADLVAAVAYDFVRGHADRQQLDGRSKPEAKAIVNTFIELLRGELAVQKRPPKGRLSGFGSRTAGRTQRPARKSPTRRSPASSRPSVRRD